MHSGTPMARVILYALLRRHDASHLIILEDALDFETSNRQNSQSYQIAMSPCDFLSLLMYMVHSEP